jgi:hypothetical protein
MSKYAPSAPRTAATLVRLQQISDAMQAQMMRKNHRNTDDYYMVMVKLATRAMKLNQYAALLEQEVHSGAIGSSKDIAAYLAK